MYPRATTLRHAHRKPLRYWPVRWDTRVRRWRCVGCGNFIAGLR